MRVPERIGPYRVLRRLGEGGMGVVYAVEDPTVAGRVLALKLILDEGEGPDALARFQREADVLARLRHPDVVRVHEVGRVGEGPYLLMDLVEGQPLHGAFARGLPPPRDAARLVRDLCGAVAAVHAAGALHRDLKPQNVLLRPDGRPLLLDFGVARDLAAERLTRTGQLLGTPGFMAPEQANALRDLDARVDVYGLGAVLYWLLAGRAPFEGSVVQVTLKTISRDPPWPRSLRPEVPEALDAIVRRAMARDRAARFPDVTALRGALDAWLEGRVAPRSSRAPLAVASVAALVVAVVVSANLPTPSPPDTAVDGPAAVASVTSGATPTLDDGLSGAERAFRARLPAGLRADGPGRYVNERDGSPLRFVAGGPRVVGTEEPNPREPLLNALPQRVRLSPYLIGEREVTWGQFLTFCAATGRPPPPGAPGPGPAHPVVNVTWHDAAAYAAWAGLRLPTEAEWECAARDPAGGRYAWGDAPPEGRCNWEGAQTGGPSPAGAFPGDRSHAGALDMSGNVIEWVQDEFAARFESAPEELVDPAGPREGSRLRSQRGGSYAHDESALRVTRRTHDFAESTGPTVGMRVARDAR